MVSFEGFAAYARLDDAVLEVNSEAMTAQLCLDAAIAHAKSAGVPTDKLNGENNAKYELYIYAIALHYYDNRGFISPGNSYAGDEYTKRMMQAMRVELAAEGW